MKHSFTPPVKFCLCALLTMYGITASAQYKGGSNDGSNTLNIAGQNTLTNIYKGGSNDGTIHLLVTGSNSLNSIYTGGTDDGTMKLSALSQNSLNGIYTGGTNDGSNAVLSLALNASNNIYLGGSNDGSSKMLQSAQNALLNIFAGNSDDGSGKALGLSQNPLSPIYKGSGEDGVASIMVQSQNMSVPLPLKLLRFDGEWQGDNAVLEWQTTHEKGLDHFELERSIDGGSDFQSIAPVAARGGAFETDYRYADFDAAKLQTNTWLYRLKTLDLDGKAAYSGIVRLTRAAGIANMILYPNPTSGGFTLELKGVTDISGYSYVLHSPSGSVMMRGDLSDKLNSFDISQFVPAAYILTIVKNGELLQHFTIILKQ